MRNSSRRSRASQVARRKARRRLGMAGGGAAAVVFAVLAAALFGPLDVPSALHLPESLQRGKTSTAPPSPGPTPEPEAPPAVLALAGTGSIENREPGSDPAGQSAALAARLEAVIAGKDLGGTPGAIVMDAASGEVLYQRDPGTPRTPASIAKIVVGAAALLTLDPAQRLETRVVTGATASEVVLLGGGDSTLTTARPRVGSYPQRASLVELAAATAAALRNRGNGPIRVRIDDSLFSGPAVSPDWEPTYVSSGVVAPVSALMVSRARIRKGSQLRHPDPAVAAGRQFARLLAGAGVEVQGAVERTTAAPGAQVLASVRSTSVATLVEAMLATSDNELAESLARLVARHVNGNASFEGVTQALPMVLMQAGLPGARLRLLDGSGLARRSEMSPQLVARLLVLAAADVRLRPILTGLPVAGFSGTLAERFSSGASTAGAGLVRAKTGTLTGVAGLAGVATTPSGGLVAFAVLADGLPPNGALPARRSLDRLAAALSAGG